MAADYILSAPPDSARSMLPSYRASLPPGTTVFGVVRQRRKRGGEPLVVALVTVMNDDQGLRLVKIPSSLGLLANRTAQFNVDRDGFRFEEHGAEDLLADISALLHGRRDALIFGGEV